MVDMYIQVPKMQFFLRNIRDFFQLCLFFPANYEEWVEILLGKIGMCFVPFLGEFLDTVLLDCVVFPGDLK